MKLLKLAASFIIVAISLFGIYYVSCLAAYQHSLQQTESSHGRTTNEELYHSLRE